VVGSDEARFAYVGSYTRDGGGAPPLGISVFAVEAESGALSLIKTVESDNPSFLALDPSQGFLYAVSEIDDYQGGSNGAVEAYAIDPTTGDLSLINREDAAGAATTHLAVDLSGSGVVVANYVGGNFAVLPIREDGGLDPVSDTVEETGSGPNAERQEAPHAHGVAVDPVGGFVAVADLGIDKVKVFRLDTATGQLELVSEVSMAPGAGPRHLTFSPDGRFLYVINELNAMVTVLGYDPASGQIGSEIQTISTVPDDFDGTKSTAEIVVHPSGQFLYGSNRRQSDSTSPVADSIVSFSIDQATGALTLIGYTTDGVANPRYFAIDPTGTWLYVCNQTGNTIIQFAIDQATGELSPTGPVIDSPTPVCLVFKNA
jgi:6-phosphogluconolactonase (cycloisomerase 2 family)